MPPTERPRAKDPERLGKGSNPQSLNRLASSTSVHWLDDFLMREGIVRDSLPLLGERQRLGQPHDERRDASYEPMQEDNDDALKSRHFPAVAGVATLLALLGLGGLAYISLSNSSGGARPPASGIARDRPMQGVGSEAARRPSPKPMGSPDPPRGLVEQAKRRIERPLPLSTKPSREQEKPISLPVFGSVPSPLWGGTDAGFPGFYPQQAFGQPLSTPSDGAAALMITAVMSSVAGAAPATVRSSHWPLSLAVSPTVSAKPPSLEAAAFAPAPPAQIGLKLAAPQTAAAGSVPMAQQRNPNPGPPPATAPTRDPLPGGKPLHLQIVYASWGPRAAKDIAALQARLEGQVRGIATAGASEWPVRHELVVYFFADDRAAAALLAASLAHITRRTAPMMLVRAKSAPQPGTVDILLPLRSGEDLINDRL